MVLSTVRSDGRPDSRVVLLKGIGESSISFYTNYESEKAVELKETPFASCCFWWPELQRQVRLRGSVVKVSREESAAYFSTRPRESQIGAWASQQSREISSREELEERVRKIEKRFHGKDVPLPDNWGGYRVELDEMEFWQGRSGRLHDRMRYRRRGRNWLRNRLSP